MLWGGAGAAGRRAPPDSKPTDGGGCTGRALLPRLRPRREGGVGEPPAHRAGRHHLVGGSILVRERRGSGLRGRPWRGAPWRRPPPPPSPETRPPPRKRADLRPEHFRRFSGE